MKPVMLFDGVCNLCNASVQFVLKRDSKEQLLFASLQSEYGQALLKKHKLSTDVLNTFILQEGDRIFQRSTAALRLCTYLPSPWKWLSIFLWIPAFFRDPIYNFIASNRYRWFGKQESCWLPNPSLKARFL